MEDKSTENENKGKGCIIGVLVLVAIIFVPMIVVPVMQHVEMTNKAKHEASLIEQGKVVSSEEFINEVIEIFKNKDEEKLKGHLAEDFVYYKSNKNKEYKYISYFFDHLTQFTTSYDIEKKDDAIEGEAFEIYWNIVEKNKEIGIKKTDKNYCLQKIRVIIKKVIKKDILTYEIGRIVIY